MSSSGTHHSGSTPMAGVFIFSIMTLTLIPYTIWAIWYREPAPEPELELWKQSKKKKGKEEPKPLATRIREGMTFHNVVVGGLWAFYVVLFFYILFAFSENKPFDPFEILGVDRGASPADIRRAWRKLSLIYHPDKNPDKDAEKYFTEYISKAYKTLTDEAARKNWEEFGHPDGPQGMNIGVALPEWLFTNDKKRQPIVLLGVLFMGFVLPIVSFTRLIGRDDNPNKPKIVKGKKASEDAIRATMSGYYHNGYKPQSTSAKVLDMLTLSGILLEKFPIPREQIEAIATLLKKLAVDHPELKSDDFKRRRGELTKCHLFLLAILDRKAFGPGSIVPPELQAELPLFMDEVMPHIDILTMVCHAPRALDSKPLPEGTQPLHLNWWSPYESTVELSQCIFQAVNPSNIKIMAGGRKEAAGGGDYALLQLPGMTVESVRKLAKVEKVKSIKELLSLPLEERQLKLMSAGAALDRLEEVEEMLDMVPEVHVAVAVRGPGPNGEIYEEKPFLVVVHMLLTRRAHGKRRADGRDLQGRTLNLRALRELDTSTLPMMMAYTPNWPTRKEERWNVAVGIPDSNLLLGPGMSSPFAMVQAEHLGFLAADLEPAVALAWDKILPADSAKACTFADSFSAAAREAAAGSAGVKRSALSKGFLDKNPKQVSAKGSSTKLSAKDAPAKAEPREGDVEEVDDKAASPTASDKKHDAAGAAAATNGDAAVATSTSARPKDLPVGQVMELQVTAPPKAGAHEIVVLLSSDTWLGCDVRVPVTITVRDSAALERDRAAAIKKAQEEAARQAEKDAEEIGSDSDTESDSDDEGREKADEYESDDLLSSSEEEDELEDKKRK